MLCGWLFCLGVWDYYWEICWWRSLISKELAHLSSIQSDVAHHTTWEHQITAISHGMYKIVKLKRIETENVIEMKLKIKIAYLFNCKWLRSPFAVDDCFLCWFFSEGFLFVSYSFIKKWKKNHILIGHTSTVWLPFVKMQQI